MARGLGALVLLLCGCAHVPEGWHSPASLRRALMQRRWTEPPEVLEAKLAKLAPWNAKCDASGCVRCFTPPQLHEPACLVLHRVRGGTRLDVPDDWWVDEDVLEPVLAALRDRPSVAALASPAAGPPPRPMGPVIGLHWTVGPVSEFGPGLRAGWRWWTSPGTAFSALAEYDHDLYDGEAQAADPYSGRETWQPALVLEPILAATVRFEVGEPTPLFDPRFSAMKVSLGAFASGTLRFPAPVRDWSTNGPLRLEPMPGFRVGLGLYAGRVGHLWLPVFIELAADVTFIPQFDAQYRGWHAAAGVGF